MKSKVRVGSKVSLKEDGEVLVGFVYGMSGSTNSDEVAWAGIQFKPPFLRGWMHNGSGASIYDEYGNRIKWENGLDDCYFVHVDSFKVLDY